MHKQLSALIIFTLLIASANAQMENKPWFHTTTIYQIYPRSFYDSNGDGIGDIQGIIQKLDYIKGLGFETIWCSPFFKSPQKDFGYDISDYTDVAPEYGTIKDVEQLIAEVHKRGMKIVFDMVMNHTSNEHPWFRESAASTNNPKSDWYLWRNKPNHWHTLTSRHNWHYVKERNQYYWASFLPFQPDLNYRNPEVKKQMFGAVQFWLQKGVDGYRLDMFNSVYKDAEFRSSTAVRKDVAAKYDLQNVKHEIKGFQNLPESFQFSKDLRSVCDSFGDKMLLGEVYGSPELLKNYLGHKKNDGINLVFSFEMLRFNFSAGYFHQLISKLEKNFPDPYMPVYVFSNHDRRRSLKRLHGNIAKAKVLHLMQLTVRGVPCMYYGEEIGMQDARFAYKTALDPIAHQYKIPRFLVDMAGETLNRDELRTPMQWNSNKNAGFSTAEKTWLPAHTDFTEVNVEREAAADSSLLNTIKKILTVRNAQKAMQAGELELLDKHKLPHNVLAYKRKMNNEEVVVLMNFSKTGKQFAFDYKGEKIFAINAHDELSGNKICLSPFGGIVIKK